MTKTTESKLKQELEENKSDTELILLRLRGEWELSGNLEDIIGKAMESIMHLSEALAGADEVKNDDYARGMAAAYKDAQHRLSYILDQNEIDKDILCNTHEIPASYLQ